MSKRIAAQSRSGAVRIVAAVALVAVVASIYLFIMTAGRGTRAAQYTNFYDLQAEGFRRGQLHLSVDPPPALLKKEDPFHRSNRPLWLWDATLHKGRYYMYWGPVPALALAAVKSVIPLRPVGDQWLALVFAFLRFLAGMALIMAMARWFRVGARSAPSLMAAAVFGLATPLPYFVARGAVYEAAIAAGQFFLLAGLACAFQGLVCERNRRAGAWLLSAGLCWALALGSRLSLLPCVGVLMVLLLLARLAIEGRPSLGRSVGLLAAVGAPVALSLAGLALYNQARFGSFTEVGVKSQLTWMHFRWSADYIPLNVVMYLFRPLDFTCLFPFWKAPWQPVARALPPGWKRPEGYDVEPLGGLLSAAPFNVLAFIPVVVVAAALLRYLLARRKGVTVTPLVAFAGRAGAIGIPWPVLFIVLAAMTMATLPALGYLGLWISSMRYAVDISAGVTLLAAMGSWMLWTADWSHRRWRVIAIALCLILASATIIVALLLGTQGYHDQFQNNNPPLWKELTSLRICRGR